MLKFHQLFTDKEFLPELRSELRELQQYVESAVEHYLATPQNVAAMEAVNECYWSAVRFLLRQKSREHAKGALDFTERQQLVMDLGFLDERLLAEGQNAKAYLQAMVGEQRCFVDVVYFGEHINAKFLECIRVDDVEVARGKRTARRSQVSVFKRELGQLIERRDRLYRNAPKPEKLLNCSRRLDELLPYYSRVNAEMSEGKLDRAGMEKFKSVKQAFDELKKEEVSLLRSIAGGENIRQAAADVTRKQLELVRAEMEAKAADEKVQSLKHKLQAIVPREKERIMLAQMQNARQVTEAFGARFLRKNAFAAAMNQPSDMNSRKSVARELLGIAKQDLEFARKLKAQERKALSVALLPGVGAAIYEAATRTIWVPMGFHNGAELSFAQCLGQCRFELMGVQETTYAALGRSKGARSTAQLRRLFGEDYAKWMARDSKGFRQLDGVTHKWFVENLKK